MPSLNLTLANALAQTQPRAFDYSVGGGHNASGPLRIHDMTAAIAGGNASYGDDNTSSLFAYGVGSVSPCPWSDNISCNLTLSLEGTASSSNETGGGPVNPYPLWQLIVLAVLATVTCCVTIVGNLVVLLSFVLERAIRQPRNYFIASLAASDLMIGSFSMPFYTVYLLSGAYWPLGEVLCDLWLSLDYTVCLISIYTVFFITIDRFCSVRIPAKYRDWRSENKVYIIIALLWVVSFIVFFTSICGWQYFVGERNVPAGKCYVQYMEDALFNCILQIGYFWVTLTVMCILYAGIYKVALDLQRRSNAKQKKMTSLVSMAGQTMTKIGIGMSKQPNSESAKNGNTRKSSSPGNTHKTSSTSFTGPSPKPTGKNTHSHGHGRHKDKSNKLEEDRSSSPAYPSDTDPSSQSPKRNSPPRSDTGKTEDGGVTAEPPKSKPQSETSNCISNSMSALYGSLGQNQLTASAASTVSAVQVLEPCLTTEQENESNLAAEAQFFQFPTQESCLPPQRAPSPPPDETDGAAAAPLHSISGMISDQDLPLPSPPAYIDPIEFADQDSRKSQASNENYGFDDDDADSNTTHALIPTEPDSPVWKKRDSFVERESRRQSNMDRLMVETEPLFGDKSSGSFYSRTDSCSSSLPDISYKRPSHNSLSQVGTPECARGRSRHVTTIQVEGPEKAKKAVTKIAKADEIQPLNAEESSHKRKRSKNRLKATSPLKGIVKSVNSRKSKRKAKKEAREKQKSRSENRARKALRTITIILGAFVLCWTPWHILSMIIGFCPSDTECVPQVLYDISYWLCYLNSPINPFCYAFANQQFKKAFIRIMKLDWHRT